jgi:hypothetical protein
MLEIYIFLYTPVYYDKNNYERKEDETSGHGMAGVTLSWPSLVAPPIVLHTSQAPHHIASSAPPIHPVSSCSQWGGAVIIDPHCWSPSVITHMLQPSSEFLPTSSCL